MPKKKTVEDWWSEEDEEELEEVEEAAEEEEIDENDLTQLPSVDEPLAKKLKQEGYESLWDISMADIDDLEKYVGITRELAKKILTTADKLLGIIR
jgi:hypothetical protein